MKLAFCLILIVTSIIRSFQLYFISTRDLRIANDQDRWFFKQQDTTPSHVTTTTTRQDIINHNLFYFIQISDLHISKFQTRGHAFHFLHFLQSVLPVVKPEFVVVTGDLIDAKDKAGMVSKQHVEEWQVYQSAVKEAASDIPWYDMRGNHDCFDLVGWEAENNYYKEFGTSALDLDLGKGVYQWQVNKPFGNYSFVAVDACPKKGPSRPFNFFGYLTTNTMNRLVSTILPNTFNHTFLFGHYPTTTMIPGTSSEGYTYTDIVKHVSVYFCGHLHRLAFGLGEVLQSYNKKADSLELELSDMKDHGSFRIVAVDHDLISFVDIDLPIHEIKPANQSIPLTDKNEIIWPKKKIHPSPIILITNPKDARYSLPSKEPLENIKKSTHIRFLLFSEYQSEQLDIQVFIDENLYDVPIHCQKNTSLCTLEWNPNGYMDSQTHFLRIRVTIPNGKSSQQEIPFRLDYSRINIYGGVGEWIIWSSVAHLLRFLCLFAISAMLTCLVVPKIYNQDKKANDFRNRLLLSIHEKRRFYQLYVWLHRFFNFPESQPKLWTMCVLFLSSLLTLPWFKAEFIPSGTEQTQRMGYFYLWGILFENDQWVTVDTWFYAIFQLTFNVGVFILFFIWKSTPIELIQCKANDKEKVLLCDRLWFQCLLCVYWLWRFNDLVDLARCYGGIHPTLVFNLITWWMLMVAFVLVKSICITNKSEPSSVYYLEICEACQESMDDATINSDDEESRYLLQDDSIDGALTKKRIRTIRRNT